MTFRALNLSFNFINTGNTATKDFSFYITCLPSNQDLKEPWVLFEERVKNIEQTPSFIAPHSSIQIGCSFSSNDVTQITEGKLFGFVLIEAKYKDRIDNSTWHVTQQALAIPQLIIKKGPLAADLLLMPRGRHNCADEECPQ